jgi:hypothetical protein
MLFSAEAIWRQKSSLCLVLTFLLAHLPAQKRNQIEPKFQIMGFHTLSATSRDKFEKITPQA